MRINNDYLDKNIQQIEREAQDDLALLLEFGLDYFETRELFILLDELDFQAEKIISFKKLLLFAAAFMLLSIAAAVYAFFNNQLFVGYTFLFFIPVFIGIASFFSYKFQKRYTTFKYTQYLQTLIEHEIDVRQQTSIF